MKSFFNIGMTLLVLFASNLGYAQITKVKIVATGLTCSMCSNAIQKQLKKMPEVAQVETNLNTNTFNISLKKNHLSPNDFKGAIEKAGFFVGEMIVSLPFNKQKIEPNKAVLHGDFSLIFTNETLSYLDGNVDLKILNKGFVTQKEYKKWTTKNTLLKTTNNKTFFVNLQQ
jgi:copper chaperone CopZ